MLTQHILTEAHQVVHYLEFTSQFKADIRHVTHNACTDNAAAYTLSRIESNALLVISSPLVDFETMNMAQQTNLGNLHGSSQASPS